MMRNTYKRPSLYSPPDGTSETAAGRRTKTAAFRAVIRACFYLHCALALSCIILSIAFSAGADIVKISVCALTSVVFAFFAVGDIEHINIISTVIDFVFAAGGYVLSIFGDHRTLFLICGILMSILAISSLLSVIAAARKRALQDNALNMLRRERDLLQHHSDDLDDIPDMPEDLIVEQPPQEIPPPVGKMRELANQVCEIICGASEKK